MYIQENTHAHTYTHTQRKVSYLSKKLIHESRVVNSNHHLVGIIILGQLLLGETKRSGVRPRTQDAVNSTEYSPGAPSRSSIMHT